MSDATSPALIDTLQRAARVAGELLLEGYRASDTIAFECKGASDFVTHYDKAAERAIIDTIHAEFPEFGFLGEETGATPTTSGITVIIDPLDGTNNFLHKLPHFSVSIALREGRELVAGVVYHPVLDEMLWAQRGRGAHLGTHRLAPPTAKALAEMLVSTCFPYHAKGDCPRTCRELTRLMPRVAGIRNPGSAALEIAQVAMGRFDAFWNAGARLEPWDIAAGIVIAREAGLTVTDLEGNADPDEWRGLLVAHPERHGELLALLAE